MQSKIRRLFHKEFKELDKIVKELEDVKKRTTKGINILRSIIDILEDKGETEKADALRKEILLLEEEVSDERKAERFVTIVEESLPKAIE
ncbi:MAG: hypothetical protein JSW73_01625 [Candidatus Woesearchaeota archaeon]|nr:MAG: hypothetical protein JSW73_01625 [Candidatus Woesearchaeota archaeon]